MHSAKSGQGSLCRQTNVGLLPRIPPAGTLPGTLFCFLDLLAPRVWQVAPVLLPTPAAPAAAAVQEGESIRQTAERVLGDTIELEGVQPYFVGNAPAGHVETPEGTLFFNRCVTGWV